jgi:hypothetical protein
MGFLLPQRRLLGNTFRDHSIFMERQDLRGEIRRSEVGGLVIFEYLSKPIVIYVRFWSRIFAQSLPTVV